LINPKPKRQEKPPPKIADESSSSFTPKSNQGGGLGTLLSPSKTNEERVARIIKDLNWQAKFDELSDNLKNIKKKQRFAR
jgi:hypothetical protein